MACIEKIYSVSAVIPGNKCNANCSFCAGKSLRKEQESVMPSNYEAAIKLSARYGGWSLSLTSGGEPTCTPEGITDALEKYQKCAKEGSSFPNVILFTNGILLGDKGYCDKWFPLWKTLGLTGIAVSVHSSYNIDQGAVYRVKYPYFSSIFDNIKEHGLQCRSTILLRRGGIETPADFEATINHLESLGCKNITTWPIGNADGTRNKYTPSRWNLFKIKMWLRLNCKKCHGHVWGGGVYDYNGTLVRTTDYVTKHKPNSKYVRQLVVSPNGDVNYSWIRRGSLCFKM